MSPTAALDRTHSDSIVAVEQIRRRLAVVLADVVRWEPEPCPADWKATPR